MKNNFEVIKCKNGVGFSFCNTDYSNDVDWLLQKAYYVSQGCIIVFAETADMKRAYMTDASLLHDHDSFEQEAKKLIEDKYVNDPQF